MNSPLNSKEIRETLDGSFIIEEHIITILCMSMCTPELEKLGNTLLKYLELYRTAYVSQAWQMVFALCDIIDDIRNQFIDVAKELGI